MPIGRFLRRPLVRKIGEALREFVVGSSQAAQVGAPTTGGGAVTVWLAPVRKLLVAAIGIISTMILGDALPEGTTNDLVEGILAAITLWGIWRVPNQRT